MRRFAEQIAQDVRFGLRSLAKTPGFSVVAILTLAVGVGANAALFSLVRGILLQPLPYDEPGRLVQVWETNPDRSRLEEGTATGNIKEWRRRNDVFEGIAGWYVVGRTLRTGPDPEVVRTAQVSTDFFPLLGTPPLIGRAFTADETARSTFSSAAAPTGPDPVVILGHRIWKRRFGADPRIVGKKISLERREWLVVGVMPPEFGMPDRGVELWIPWSFEGNRARDQHYPNAIARMKRGVTIEHAQEQMDRIATELGRDFPVTNLGWGIRLVPLHEQRVGSARPALLVLFSAVGIVLLIACANIANLQLARAGDRRREIAVRLTLGASRFRVVRQLLIENLMLALAGGLGGILLGLWGLDALKRLQPTGIPRLHEASLDVGVLLFTLAVALATGLLFGLAPAMEGARTDLSLAIKENGARGASAGLRRQRSRHLLVVAEIAMAMILLAGAGLLVRSFARLTAVDPGFDMQNVLVVPIFLDAASHGGAKTRAYYAEVIAELSALPGVVSVGGATALPMSLLGPDFDRPAWREGDAPPAAGKFSADIRMATPGYFDTMGMSILRGRSFLEEDRPDSIPIVIVNETLASSLWGGENPVGQRLVLDYGGAPYAYEVVGVVNDVRFYGLRSSPRPEVYLPHAQRSYLIMNMAVRTDRDAQGLAFEVRSAVLRVDPDQPAHSVAALEDLVGDSVARERFSMLLLGTFAAVSLVLAALGIFGVLSYVVGRRSFEFGVRMALGATQRDILQLVLRRGAILAMTGVLIGTAVSFAVTRFLSSLLFRVSATDPATFVGVAILLLSVALLACYGPARRATRVDAILALRCD